MAEYIEREAVKAAIKKRLGTMDLFESRFNADIDAIPAADVVDVDKAMQFLEGCSFKDEQEIYTNGTILVPLFRVKQALVDKAYNGFREG